MVEALLGAASVAVAVLAYVVVVECLTAAVVLLAQFIALQVRSLRAALTGHPHPAAPAREVHEARGDGDRQSYRLGGDVRWR
jgi:hypothetical protein